MANLLLTDAMHTSEALFDAVGVQREVVVDHEVRTLEVDGPLGVAAAASTNVYCGLSAASPQDVSKRPTMTNRAES